MTSDITLDLCAHIQNFSGLDVLMHITCTFMTRDKVIESLDRVNRCLISNRQENWASEISLLSEVIHLGDRNGRQLRMASLVLEI